MIIKLESVNQTTFRAAGKSFLKGQYTIEYDNESTDPTTGVVTSANVFLRPNGNVDTSIPVGQKLPWKLPRGFSQFLDSTGTPYVSFSAFTDALAALIASPTNSSVSDLISDKGTVTQASTISTGVTLSVLNGKVTTVSSTLAADASASFVVTNTKVATTSNIVLGVNYAGTQGVVVAEVTAQSSGSFTVKVDNCGTQALNNTITIGFLVV